MVPDSYTRTVSGACVSRARLAAVLGRPMPTKQTVRSVSSRAAATVITSSALNSVTTHHLLLHPVPEAVAVTADLVPALVEAVVAVIVVVRVGGVGAARRLGHGSDRPRRQHYRAGAGLELVHDLLHGHERAPRGEHDLLLNADDAPELHVALAVRALCVHHAHVGPDGRHRRQLLAGEWALDGRHVRVPHQIRAGVAAQHREGE